MNDSTIPAAEETVTGSHSEILSTGTKTAYLEEEKDGKRTSPKPLHSTSKSSTLPRSRRHEDFDMKTDEEVSSPEKRDDSQLDITQSIKPLQQLSLEDRPVMTSPKSKSTSKRSSSSSEKGGSKKRATDSEALGWLCKNCDLDQFFARLDEKPLSPDIVAEATKILEASYKYDAVTSAYHLAPEELTRLSSILPDKWGVSADNLPKIVQLFESLRYAYSLMKYPKTLTDYKEMGLRISNLDDHSQVSSLFRFTCKREILTLKPRFFGLKHRKESDKTGEEALTVNSNVKHLWRKVSAPALPALLATGLTALSSQIGDYGPGIYFHELSGGLIDDHAKEEFLVLFEVDVGISFETRMKSIVGFQPHLCSAINSIRFVGNYCALPTGEAGRSGIGCDSEYSGYVIYDHARVKLHSLVHLTK